MATETKSPTTATAGGLRIDGPTWSGSLPTLTTTDSSSDTSQDVSLQGFGFSAVSVLVDTIQVDIELSFDDGGDGSTVGTLAYLALVKADSGAPAGYSPGTNKADGSSWTGSKSFLFSVADWGLSLTPAEVKDSLFGVALECATDDPDSASWTATIVSVSITVEYGIIDVPADFDYLDMAAPPGLRRVPRVQPPPIESAPVGPVREDVHIANLGPMYVQPRPRPCERAFLEPLQSIDPAVLLLPAEIEPLRVEQIMTMGVQRPPAPRRRPEQVILMGEYDPASLGLPNAPEFIHPENQVPMACLPIGPQASRAWLDPISSEVASVAKLSAGSAEPATYHEIDQNPRRDWPRQYQPPANNLDPGAPTVSSTPLAVLPPMAVPQRQRPRVQPPVIEVRSLVTATPGDQSVYPTHFSMTSNPTAARRQVRQPAESLILDAWSGQQFVEPPMFVARPAPQRASVPAVEASSLAPQQFGDQQIIGWNTPLAVPVRVRKPAQNIALAGELAGETTDLALMEPTAWQPTEPAMLNRRREANQPPMESLGLNLPAAVIPSDLSPMAVPANRPTRRPAASSELPVFIDVAAANAEGLESMDVPLPQLRRQAASLTGQGTEFFPIVVAVTFSNMDFATPLSMPVIPPRHVGQLPVEVEPMDRGAQSPVVVPGMDAQRLSPPRRPQPSPTLPLAIDVLAGSVDFMEMSIPQARPPRANSHHVIVSAPPLNPAVLQTTTEPIESMYVQPRRLHRPQQLGAAALLVGQDLFGGLPNVADFQADWIVPARLPRVQPVEIERTTTTSFFATGNEPTFTGTGITIVSAAGIWSLAPKHARIFKPAKGT